ncbi:hypothetical protein LR48_Vigan10g176500 [Vigna angularis]|uniref:Transposase (putative) gypsy type domain-containing protein n=1 Tax=Phaseolus angularis TaxID=3914 RepID=A0A0L9VLL6_PHAAN|nr:hypothetical protein LR48_Vigan10g176500 [Vigna angularis]
MSLFLLKSGVRIDQEVAEPPEGWPRIKGYRWASHDVGLFRSDYSTRDELQWWADRSHIVRDQEDPRLIRSGVFFQVVVLHELNVASTQLHPNGWVVIQAFITICAAMGITPSVPVFLHYFNVRPLAKRGWVIINEVGRSEFRDEAGLPLFPFYWTKNPQKIKAWAAGRMTLEDLEVVRIINALPCRLNACGFVECLSNEDFDQMAFGYMSLPAPRKTSFTSSHKRQGEGSSKGRDPWTASSSRSSMSQKVRPVIPVTEQVTVVVHQDPPVVDLKPSAGTTPTIVVVSSNKRRKTKEGEKSSSKRSRREGSSPRLLPAVCSRIRIGYYKRLGARHWPSQKDQIVQPASQLLAQRASRPATRNPSPSEPVAQRPGAARPASQSPSELTLLAQRV